MSGRVQTASTVPPAGYGTTTRTCLDGKSCARSTAAAAEAVAPLVGGFLFVHADWHAIFWFLAVLGVVLWVVMWRKLPETLHREARQPFDARNLLR